jgi:antitoxin VapB
MEDDMYNTAKLFKTGRSQAVRLPMEYRFEGTEVYIRRDPITGDVILSKKPESWEGFFSVLANTTIPDNFMEDRNLSTSTRNPFEDWSE